MRAFQTDRLHACVIHTLHIPTQWHKLESAQYRKSFIRTLARTTAEFFFTPANAPFLTTTWLHTTTPTIITSTVTILPKSRWTLYLNIQEYWMNSGCKAHGCAVVTIHVTEKYYIWQWYSPLRVSLYNCMWICCALYIYTLMAAIFVSIGSERCRQSSFFWQKTFYFSMESLKICKWKIMRVKKLCLGLSNKNLVAGRHISVSEMLIEKSALDHVTSICPSVETQT